MGSLHEREPAHLSRKADHASGVLEEDLAPPAEKPEGWSHQQFRRLKLKLNMVKILQNDRAPQTELAKKAEAMNKHSFDKTGPVRHSRFLLSVCVCAWRGCEVVSVPCMCVCMCVCARVRACV